MRYSKSTRYALWAVLELATAAGPVSAAAVAARYRIPAGALARVMQDLVRVGVARGVRGVGGGYVLARPAAEITVLDVISVFGSPPAAEAVTAEGGAGAQRLQQLLAEVDEMARCTLASVTLETLVRT